MTVFEFLQATDLRTFAEFVSGCEKYATIWGGRSPEEIAESLDVDVDIYVMEYTYRPDREVIRKALLDKEAHT